MIVNVKGNGGGLFVYVYDYVYESLVAGVWWRAPTGSGRVTRNFESGRRKAESRREAQKSNQPEAIFAWARGDCAGAQAPKPQSPEG